MVFVVDDGSEFKSAKNKLKQKCFYDSNMEMEWKFFLSPRLALLLSSYH